MKNKIVLITGASSGIGEACAKAFAKEGAKILVCARRIERVLALVNLIKTEFRVDSYGFQLDVRNFDEVNAAIKSLPQPWKKIDVLVNNAGLAAGLDLLQESDVANWDAMLDTNVKGLLYVTRAILPNMVCDDSGHVINIGSIAGHEVYSKGAVYCASKHAVKALSLGLRQDLLGTNIRVSSIDPGMVESNFSNVRFKGNKKRAKAVYEGFQALTPMDVADAVVYCATRPPHVNISDLILMPTAQASATLVARK